jgi:hypothetical protein
MRFWGVGEPATERLGDREAVCVIQSGEQATLAELGARAEQWIRQNAQELAMGAASGLTTSPPC